MTFFRAKTNHMPGGCFPSPPFSGCEGLARADILQKVSAPLGLPFQKSAKAPWCLSWGWIISFGMSAPISEWAPLCKPAFHPESLGHVKAKDCWKRFVQASWAIILENPRERQMVQIGYPQGPAKSDSNKQEKKSDFEKIKWKGKSLEFLIISNLYFWEISSIFL